jgi:glycosyltransferase involved in cell wall biosynthesis
VTIDAVFISPPLEYSAATLYTLSLASALVQAGTKPRVIAPGGRFEAAFRERGIDVAIEPFLDRFVVDWFLLRRLVRDLREAGVRVVHGQSATKAATTASLAARLGVPAVLTIHRYYDASNPSEIDFRRLAAVVTLGENLRADVVNRRRAPRDIVHVVPAGIAPGPDPAPPFARASAPPVIGTLGEVERRETQEHFVRAARIVLAEAPDAQFLILGEGADPKALRSLIRALGLWGSFTFSNVIDNRKILPEMDVCVMPSVKEGAGHAILEAMAAARPVIATGEGGAYEVVQDEQTGFLVAKDDPELLARAVLRLLFDRDLARRAGARAREVVLERYPVDRMVRDTLAIYARVTSGA